MRIAKRWSGPIVHAAALGALAMALVAPALPMGQAPQAQVWTGDMKLVGCEIPSGLVFVQAHAPTRVGGGGPPTVEFTGHVETARDFCGDEVRILGQRKVCGFFGCHYETIEQTGFKELGQSIDLRITHECKSGTHRYRTLVEYTAPNARNAQSPFFVQDKRESDQITC